MPSRKTTKTLAIRRQAETARIHTEEAALHDQIVALQADLRRRQRSTLAAAETIGGTFYAAVAIDQKARMAAQAKQAKDDSDEIRGSLLDAVIGTGEEKPHSLEFYGKVVEREGRKTISADKLMALGWTVAEIANVTDVGKGSTSVQTYRRRQADIDRDRERGMDVVTPNIREVA